MGGTRQPQKGQPDLDMHNLFAALNEEQQKEKHDISGLYEGRLRSHAEDFESLKRRWEGFTGAPVPKRLRPSEPVNPPGEKEKKNPNQTSATELKKANAVILKKTASTTMPPHPDDKINVDIMPFNELRKELRKRQLKAVGKKHELRARLKQYFAVAKQKREADWAARYSVKKAETQMMQVKNSRDDKCGSYNDVKEIDAVMEDAIDAGASMENSLPHTGKLVKNASLEKLKSEMSSKLAGVPNYAMKKQVPPKSALKPSKYTSSFSQSNPNLDDAKPMMKEYMPAPKQVPTKISDSPIETSKSSVVISNSTMIKPSQMGVQKPKISSTLAQTTNPGRPIFKAKTGGGSMKLLEKKKAHARANEERKKRMAEMRQKAKPIVSSVGSTTKQLTSQSKYAVPLTKMASCSNLGESKPNSILAKMREKAAAEKNTDHAVNNPPTKQIGVKQAVVVKHSSSMSSLSSTSQHSKAMMTSKPAFKSTALKSILDPANKPSMSKSTKLDVGKSVVVESKEKSLPPLQTYEMSDREEESDSESESDEEDYERQRPKKTIPVWAHKTNLFRALERQFADRPNRVDPDKIFGEVITCNLEEIFDKKKSRYQRRTSSGNWTKDHVTLAEKITYKKVMGYDK